jgi:DNA-binding LacI/PurR family transcriptional regulator
MFVCGPASQEDSYWREIGYRQALDEHGIIFNPKLVITSEFERTIAYREMHKFLTNAHPEFDAIFTGDDDSAIGVVTALQEFDYRVPEDIGIAGFDDLRFSVFFSPPLTTVRAPTELVGKTAALHLFDLLSGKEVEPVTSLPTEIIIRRSCGCQV